MPNFDYRPTANPPVDPYVRIIQEKLNYIRVSHVTLSKGFTGTPYNWEHLVPDGQYGEKTARVVQAFQSRRGIIPASGILGPTTARFIDEAYNKGGVSNEYVRDIQKKLNHVCNLSIAEDGLWGMETIGAVRLFRNTRGLLNRPLSPNGELDMETMRKLNEEYLGGNKLGSQDDINYGQTFECGITNAIESIMNKILGEGKAQYRNAKYLRKQDFFKSFTRWLSNMRTNFACIFDSELRNCRFGVEKNKGKNKSNSKAQAKIKEIAKSKKICPDELAKNISGKVGTAGKAAGGVAKWWTVGKSVFEFITHLWKWEWGNVEWEQKTLSLFFKIVDAVILTVITAIAVDAAVAAIGAAVVGGGWVVLVVIIVSVLIALLIDLIYQLLCYIAGDSQKPLSLSIIENVLKWFDSSECERILEPKQLYIQAAPQKQLYIQAAPPKYYIQNPR